MLKKKRQHDNEITDSLLSLTPLTVEKISSGRICAEGKIIPLFFLAQYAQTTWNS